MVIAKRRIDVLDIQRLANGELRHIAVHRADGDAAARVLSEADFQAAWDEITSWQGYRPTPLMMLPELAVELGLGELIYKHEGPRFGLGSFKALGGAYAALRVLQRAISARNGKTVSLRDVREGRHRDLASELTLVSATDGNHGRSLAWGCGRFGAKCKIYIHAEVSEGRADAMRDLGADVVRIDGDYDASVALAREEAETHGWFVVSDTSWPGYFESPRDVMAGYGVMTREICSELTRPPTHIFLQGGVGGLAASVAAGLKQIYKKDSPRVVVVEPEWAACLFESARNGDITTVSIENETVMAGLSCGEPSELAWEILQEEASDFLTVPDWFVAPAMRRLAKPKGNDPVVEAGESAVAGLSSLLALQDKPSIGKALGLDRSSRVLLIGSEGVTDPLIFAEMMAESTDA